MAQVELGNDIFSQEIEQFRDGDILGMPCYQGRVNLPIVDLNSGKREQFSIKVRVILGSEVPPPSFLRQGNQFSDALSSLFFQAISVITANRIAYFKGFDKAQGTEIAYDAIMRQQISHPDIPISVVYTHGYTWENQYRVYIGKGKDGFTDSQVISAIKAKDNIPDEDTEQATVIFSSCNQEGIPIRGNANVIYPVGLAGTFGDGKVAVSRPGVRYND